MTRDLKRRPDSHGADRAPAADGLEEGEDPGGVYVLTPEGKLLGRISTGERTANCAWGGDGSVLYLTADMYLCRIQTTTKGAGW